MRVAADAERDDSFVGEGGGGGAQGGLRKVLLGWKGQGVRMKWEERWGGRGTEVSMGGGETAETSGAGRDCEQLQE